MFVERAGGFVDAMAAAKSRRGFLAAAAEFEHMLVVVPEYPGTFFQDTDYARISALVDRAIAQIEARLAARTDRAAVQRQLAATIYRLRAELEKVYVRLHETATGRPPDGATVCTPSK